MSHRPTSTPTTSGETGRRTLAQSVLQYRQDDTGMSMLPGDDGLQVVEVAAKDGLVVDDAHSEPVTLLIASPMSRVTARESPTIMNRTG